MKIRFHRQPGEPERDDGIKVSYAPAKRRFPKYRWYLILLVVCSPLIYFVTNVLMNNVLVKAQGFVSLNLVEVRSAHSGVLSKVFVKPWDMVKKDDLLASLSGEVVNLSDDAKLTRVSLLEKSVELAQAQATDQEKRLQAMEKLFDDGAATAAEVAAAKDRLEKSTYLLYTKLTELETERAAQMHVARAALDRETNGYPVKSPTNGRVVEIPAIKNTFVPEGKVILVVAEPGEPLVTAYLDPKFSRYAHMGQRAIVKFTDGKRFTAHIVELPKVTKKLPVEFTSAFGTRPLSVLVRLALDEPLPEDHQIHGLPVAVRFYSDLENFLHAMFDHDKTVLAKAE